MKSCSSIGILLLMFLSTSLAAQDRETKVRQDKHAVDPGIWIYNDMTRALTDSKRAKRPLMVVLRCIPCEACSQFDQQLLADDNEVRDLLGQFVCVRIVQGNGLDLALFQFDYDQSFHVMFLNADRTVYGRFGTRSARKESEDMTMAGLRQAMLGALALHKNYPANRQDLIGKQPITAIAAVPEKMEGLTGKYGPKLNEGEKLVESCIHCHQIRDAERIQWRGRKQPFPQQLLFPYPLPDVLGLRVDPAASARIAEVAEGSIADRAGLKEGDEIRTLAGQPILSTADLQWVLHRADLTAEIPAEIERQGATIRQTLALPLDWRTACDISWRPTTWDLRRMATGGLVLEDLPDAQRASRKLGPDSLALRIKHVGHYGEHAAAERAGFQTEDVLVQFGEHQGRLSESQLLALALRHPRGAQIEVVVLRDDRRLKLILPMQ